jgi:hypothetical protein
MSLLLSFACPLSLFHASLRHYARFQLRPQLITLA